jgi:hypothetical protein
VPITVAAGAAAVAGIVVALIAAALGDNLENMRNLMLGFVLLLGVGVFLFAMRWDSSDQARVTRRSDVAFWLHLLAAPMIVHPVFTLLGLNDGNATIGEGLVVVLLYVVLAIAALAIDRRALLVSALAYVLYALTELFKQIGAVELSVALTALVIGSALLMLSAYWHQARRLVVNRLPDALQGKLPLLDRPLLSNQPHKPALERGQHAAQVVPPLEHRAMLADQRERPLLQAKLGAFLDPHFGPLGGAPERREDRHLGVERQPVVAPVPRRDHPTVEVEDALQLATVEGGDRLPVPRVRERRHHAHAILAVGGAWRSAFSSATSLRSAASSFSTSHSLAAAGSTFSPHGVPYATNPGL